jgi:inosine-uridine nucleoside N-ribohydrolase
MGKKVNIFIDCCTGINESFIIPTLISLAINYDHINIIGISISYGEGWADLNLHTLQQILSLLQVNNQIDIYKGVDHSLIAEENFPNRPHNLLKPNYPNITGDILKNKFEQFKNEKNIFISLTNLTCISTLIMQCPDLRLYIDKFICSAGAFDDDFNKEINIFMDPHAANHIFQDPIIKNKVIMFPYGVTSKFSMKARKFDKLKCNIPQYFSKTGEQKHGLLPTAGETTDNAIMHGLPALICILEYTDKNSSSYEWGYKEHKLLFNTEGQNRGKANILKVVENTKSTPQLLGIDQKGSVVVYDMNYDDAWNTFCHYFDEADETYTKLNHSWKTDNIKLLSVLILFLSLFLSFIYRVY